MAGYVIIGGDAAGMSAASRIKRVNPNAELTVFEQTDVVSYGACGLPYYISGVNSDINKMRIRTCEQFRESGIDLRINSKAVKVYSKQKQVLVLENGSHSYLHEYDKLLVATGASPVLPPFENAGLNGIFVLKTLDDGRRIREALEQAQNMVIIGGGYIGVELAETGHVLGKNVTIIEMSRILTSFDSELHEMAKQELTQKGINVLEGERVKAFGGNHRVERLYTDKGEYPADVVVVCIGVKPNTQLFADAENAFAPNGALRVDRQMKTVIPDIYAAGDCATVYHKVAQTDVYLPLGTNANKQGRIAADNMAGLNKKFQGTLGSAAIKVLDIEMARTGLSEAEAAFHGFNAKSVFVKASSGPHYYPGHSNISIKLVYEQGTNRLLGGQAAGQQGAVLRIDALATAIYAGLTVKDLGFLDYCYAPPFAGVWDALNIAGNAAKI